MLCRFATLYSVSGAPLFHAHQRRHEQASVIPVEYQPSAQRDAAAEGEKTQKQKDVHAHRTADMLRVAAERVFEPAQYMRQQNQAINHVEAGAAARRVAASRERYADSAQNAHHRQLYATRCYEVNDEPRIAYCADRTNMHAFVQRDSAVVRRGHANHARRDSTMRRGAADRRCAARRSSARVRDNVQLYRE